MIIRQNAELNGTVSFFYNCLKNKNDFTLTKSTFFESYLFENIRYDFSDSFKSFKELGLMVAFKNQVKKNMDKALLVDVSKIKYFDYSGKLFNGLEVGEVRTFKRVIEIDISAAYLYAFLNYGFIDEILFKKIIELPKQKRLPIMGAIASVKTKQDYINGLPVGEPELVKNDLLRNVWFFISKKIDELLLHCKQLAGSNYLFYYVDGIYFSGDEKIKNKIIDYFSEKKFNSKTIICEKIEVINAGESYNLNVFKSGIKKEFKVLPKKIKYIYNG